MVQQMCTSEKKSKRVNITGISFPDVYTWHAINNKNDAKYNGPGK